MKAVGEKNAKNYHITWTKKSYSRNSL